MIDVDLEAVWPSWSRRKKTFSHCRKCNWHHLMSYSSHFVIKCLFVTGVCLPHIWVCLFVCHGSLWTTCDGGFKRFHTGQVQLWTADLDKMFLFQETVFSWFSLFAGFVNVWRFMPNLFASTLSVFGRAVSIWRRATRLHCKTSCQYVWIWESDLVISERGLSLLSAYYSHRLKSK